jgi:hypothetical protein
MFRWLKTCFLSQPRPGPRIFEDDVLGRLFWDDREEAWVVHVPHASVQFRILVAGADAPDAGLISHARDIFASPETLLAQLGPVLAAAADEIPVAAEEIAGLRITSVDLMWPDQPDNGMISFDGPDTDGRLWRCDYIGRQPRDLGFDS